MRREDKLILLVIPLTLLFSLLTTPLHEALHWIMCEIDPNLVPLEIHLFDSYSLERNCLGCVAYKELGEPLYFNPLLQEIICVLVQYSIIILLNYYIIKRILLKRKYGKRKYGKKEYI